MLYDWWRPATLIRVTKRITGVQVAALAESWWQFKWRRPPNAFWLGDRRNL